MSKKQIVKHAKACAEAYKELEVKISEAEKAGEARYANVLKKAQEGYKQEIYKCRELVKDVTR